MTLYYSEGILRCIFSTQSFVFQSISSHAAFWIAFMAYHSSNPWAPILVSRVTIYNLGILSADCWANIMWRQFWTKKTYVFGYLFLRIFGKECTSFFWRSRTIDHAGSVNRHSLRWTWAESEKNRIGTHSPEISNACTTTMAWHFWCWTWTTMHWQDLLPKFLSFSEYVPDSKTVWSFRRGL